MRGMRQPQEPAIDTSPSPGDGFKTTTCYMCACRCGIKVWLADGRMPRIVPAAARCGERGGDRPAVPGGTDAARMPYFGGSIVIVGSLKRE